MSRFKIVTLNDFAYTRHEAKTKWGFRRGLRARPPPPIHPLIPATSGKHRIKRCASASDMPAGAFCAAISVFVFPFFCLSQQKKNKTETNKKKVAKKYFSTQDYAKTTKKYNSITLLNRASPGGRAHSRAPTARIPSNTGFCHCRPLDCCQPLLNCQLPTAATATADRCQLPLPTADRWIAANSC